MNSVTYRLEELVAREYRRMKPGSICIIAASPEGSAVGMRALEEWLTAFQTTVYRVGRWVLNEKYRQGPKRRKLTDQRLCLSMGTLRTGGAYGIRLWMGREQLPLGDLTGFQQDVLSTVEEMFEGNDLLDIRKDLSLNDTAIGELTVFWRGSGLRIRAANLPLLNQDAGS